MSSTLAPDLYRLWCIPSTSITGKFVVDNDGRSANFAQTEVWRGL